MLASLPGGREEGGGERWSPTKEEILIRLLLHFRGEGWPEAGGRRPKAEGRRPKAEGRKRNKNDEASQQHQPAASASEKA